LKIIHIDSSIVKDNSYICDLSVTNEYKNLHSIKILPPGIRNHKRFGHAFPMWFSFVRRLCYEEESVMKEKTYSELFKDPRWQKKRLKVMERDGFACVSCHDKDTTLNVHHIVPYRKNAKPWEYEDDELTTLCEICHKEITDIIEYCKGIMMGRCWCLDSALEMQQIMEEFDGMKIHELNMVWKILHVIKNAKELE
jgi:uncharacterized protein YkvS